MEFWRFFSLLQHSHGVEKTFAHLFRHIFANKWILNSGNIFRLLEISTHSNLTIVSNNVSMFSNEVSIDFDKFKPLDSICHKIYRLR